MNPLKTANPLTVTEGAVGLAGTAVGVAGSMAREALHAPIGMTKGAIHLASAAAGFAENLARETAHVLWADRGNEVVQHGSGSADVADPTVSGPTTAAAADAAAGEAPGAPTGPTVVPVEPHTPTEPPVDVVGQALAGETATESGEGAGGIAHEPRGASRDEEHGDAALQRAEVEEIAQETTAALEGDVELERQLPEPLLDSAEAKALAAELATMAKAADPKKD